MKKSLASRITGLAALYCAAFCVLAILQFSGKGNFNLTSGDMMIRGRYLSEEHPVRSEAGLLEAHLTGPVKIFYEGIDINLKEERGKGLILSGKDGARTVNPESMMLTENTARFVLPDGSAVVFNSLNSARGIELQINAEFSDNVSEISIPISPRRSSLVRDNDQIGVLHSGSRYFFTTSGKELEEEKIILTRDNSFISYRHRGKQKIFNPSDFIIADAENYDNVIRNRYNAAYTYWSQNAASLQDEEDIIALLSGAIQRGNFSAPLYSVSPRILESSEHSYKSSAFVGGMSNAYRTFIASENEKINLITRSTREKNLNFLKEEHVINFLLTRSNTALTHEVIEILNNANPQMLTIEHCAGLLEVFADYRRWRPINSIDHLAEQMLQLISDNLSRSDSNNTISISVPDGNSEYSLRLGRALLFWAHQTQQSEWESIAKSLILSSITDTNSGKLFNMLNLNDYIPKSFWITDSGLWAWTAATSVRSANVNGNINLAFTFSPNMTHHVILRGVQPFLRIQIHALDWRTDTQFERYDSSGWLYYPQEQILILKLRHRSATENIRLIYREEASRPPPVETSEGDAVE